MSVDLDIYNGVFKAVDAALSPMVYPNISGDGTKPYYRINILKIPTTPLGVATTDIHEGIIQIDVVVMEGIGVISPQSRVATVLGLFPRNSRITENNTVIRFDRSGWQSPPIQSGGEFFIPVNFQFIVLTNEV